MNIFTGENIDITISSKYCKTVTNCQAPVNLISYFENSVACLELDMKICSFFCVE